MFFFCQFEYGKKKTLDTFTQPAPIDRDPRDWHGQNSYLAPALSEIQDLLTAAFGLSKESPSEHFTFD